jgi:hypothetical protein
MKHIYSIIMTASLSLAVIGCSDSGLVDVESDGESQALSSETATLGKSEVKYVPYKETGEFPDPAPVPFEDVGMVCTSAEVENKSVGYITATHFGRVPAINHLCTDFSTGVSRVHTKILANNGDHLLKQAVCVLDFSDFTYRCEIVVIGGSGRFEHASTPPGEPIIKVGQISDPTTLAQAWHAEGRISFGGLAK